MSDGKLMADGKLSLTESIYGRQQITTQYNSFNFTYILIFLNVLIREKSLKARLNS